jgi:hypothetical protein
MQAIRSNLLIKIAASLALGALTGSVFVALHFPPESESFHLSQFWESAALSVFAAIFWLCIFQAITALQAFSASSPKKLKFAWYAVLFASLGLGFLIAGFIGYSAFMGEERDWFKAHDRFLLSEYIAVSIELGLFYGSLATVGLASIGSAVLALLALIKKWTHRSTAVG